MLNELDKLINLLKRLPGVGSKSAQRIALYLIESPKDYVVTLGDTIKEIKEKLTYCSKCGNLTVGDICSICLDQSRNNQKLCIVAHVPDLWAIDKSGVFNGYYHVLNGLLSPLDGIGPDELFLNNLIERVKELEVKEIIIALPTTVEGEATSIYLKEIIKDFDVKITRIASGIPHGGELEYSDQITLARALEGRHEF